MRDKLSRIDYFLRDLSRGVARIQQGQVPDGSGKPIASAPGGDDGTYFKLAGRPTNQDAHGGTGPAGSLTLSSTTATTKGLIYLGDAKTAAYDEVNNRIGLGTVAPTAKVHIKVPQAAQILRPTADVAGSSNWGSSDGKVAPNLYQDLADNTNATWLQNGNQTGGSQICSLAHGTDPGVNTGHILHFVAKDTGAGPASQLQITLNNDTSGATLATYSNQALSLAGFVDLAISLSAADVIAVRGAGYNNLRFGFIRTSGGDGVGNNEVAEVYLEVPGTTENLQQWESPNGANTLAYALDGASATTLQLSGTPKLRLTGGLELAIGTPVANKFWQATDADGTGAWYDLFGGTNTFTGTDTFNGTLKFTIGTPASTKVWSATDAAGTGSWVTALSVASSLLSTNNTWTGTNDFGITTATRLTVTGVSPQFTLGVSNTQSGIARFLDANSAFIDTLTIPATGLTASHSIILPNLDGDMVLVGNAASPAAAGKIAKVNLTAQVANIASTILTNAVGAGTYMVSVYMVVTTAAASGTLAFNVAYTDESGAQAKNPANLVLTALKNTGTATFPISITSGNITWSTSGYVASAAYAIHIRCSYMGP